MTSLQDFRTEMDNETKRASEQRVKFYDELRSIGNDVSKIKQMSLGTVADVLDTIPHFSEYDRRINILQDVGGQLRCNLSEIGPIVCYEMDESELGAWPKLHKIIQVYSRISERVQVQGFYGILQKGPNKYAMLEDISSEPTLASAIASSALPSISVRLRMAYDIASTMAYLHQVGMLLKCLSDTTVILKMKNGEVQAMITNLESARLVVLRISLQCSYPQIIESTSSMQYDIRYEAPEYEIQCMHSVYSDVWRYTHKAILASKYIAIAD